MKYKIDSGHKTHLPICLTCGWRGDIEQTKLNALLALQKHRARAHKEDPDYIRAKIARATRIISKPL